MFLNYSVRSVCTIQSGVFAQCSLENMLLIGNITSKLFTCRVSVHLTPEKRKDNRRKIMKCAALPDTSSPRLPFITEEQLCPLTRRVMCIQKWGHETRQPMSAKPVCQHKKQQVSKTHIKIGAFLSLLFDFLLDCLELIVLALFCHYFLTFYLIV